MNLESGKEYKLKVTEDGMICISEIVDTIKIPDSSCINIPISDEELKDMAILFNGENIDEKKEYIKQGRDEAWNCAKELTELWADNSEGIGVFKDIIGNISILDIFSLSASEAIAKVKQYYEKRNFKVGDEIISSEGNKLIITAIGSQHGDLCCIDKHGHTTVLTDVYIDQWDWHKTGRYFPQVSELLYQLNFVD